MEKELSVSTEIIKQKLEDLFNNSIIIHITINDGRLKVNNAESQITGVYKYFLCVDSYVHHYKESFTIKLVDIKIGKVLIKELLL